MLLYMCMVENFPSGHHMPLAHLGLIQDEPTPSGHLRFVRLARASRARCQCGVSSVICLLGQGACLSNSDLSGTAFTRKCADAASSGVAACLTICMSNFHLGAMGFRCIDGSILRCGPLAGKVTCCVTTRIDDNRNTCAHTLPAWSAL